MRPDTGFEQLVTDRLALRRSRPEDAEAISSYRSDPEVHRFQGWERTDPQGIRDEIVEMTTRAPGDPGGWVQLSVEEFTENIRAQQAQANARAAEQPPGPRRD